jgi:hypothetical protein
MTPPSSGSKNKARKKSACHLLHADFLLGLFLDPEDGGNMFLFNGLHGVISHKADLFLHILNCNLKCVIYV